MTSATVTSIRANDEDTEIVYFCLSESTTNSKTKKYVIDQHLMWKGGNKTGKKIFSDAVTCLYLQRSESCRQSFPCDILQNQKLDFEEAKKSISIFFGNREDC